MGGGHAFVIRLGKFGPVLGSRLNSSGHSRRVSSVVKVKVWWLTPRE